MLSCLGNCPCRHNTVKSFTLFYEPTSKVDFYIYCKICNVISKKADTLKQAKINFRSKPVLRMSV